MPNMNCQHDPNTEWTGTEVLEHFFECQTLKERQAQLLQWRDAARKWWDHQERVNQLGYEVPPEVLAQAVAALRAQEQTGHPPIDVESKDMCVHVVLPGGAVLTLAADEPPTSQMLEPFGERDKRVIQALLTTAQQELYPPLEYYGPMPVVPAPPRPVKP